MDIKLTEILLMKREGNGHILRRFCTYFKMQRKYTYSKKVLYIFSINAKDLRRCEGFAKEIYTPVLLNSVKPFKSCQILVNPVILLNPVKSCVLILNPIYTVKS